MSAEAPRVLGGRYEVGDLLGYGGMAEVYAGRDVRLGREVAMKILRSDLARDPTFQARFRREAQASAQLNHPAIVSVFDTGDDEENGVTVPYIVMEYVAGRTLRDVLSHDGRLLPRRALEITAAVCEALEYSHRAGIVHRDIKPGNVMVTPTGDVKVMDFGIARAVTASAATMTQTASIIGTAQYLSPEQARGEHVDQRSDIYSTGCLLYELLTGVPPFRGESPVAVAYQHVREDPVVPSAMDPDLNPALDAVVLKAMAKNPANRYQSAAEFKEDLDRAAAGRRVEATPVLASQSTTVMASMAAPLLLDTTVADRKKKQKIAYAALAVGVVVVFVLAVLAAKSFFSGGGTGVAVPDVTGQTLDKAREILSDKGLSVGSTTHKFSGKPKGIVIEQDPTADFQLHTGDNVDLVVSDGVQIVVVPNVAGKSQDDATRELSAAKLKVGSIKTRDVNSPAGTVLSQDPAPGTKLPANSPVNLEVASGNINVPDVRTRTLQNAQDALQQAGFTADVKRVDSDQPKDTVISQDPAPNTPRPAGSSVTITVSKGQPSPSPSPSDSGSPSPSPGPSPT